MDPNTIDGELAEPPADDMIAAAYTELRLILTELPPGVIDVLAKAYRKLGRNRTYVAAADHAADIAYESRVDEHDQVVDVDPDVAALAPLGADAGHPLKGYALDVALAVLAYDRLNLTDWLLITEAWRKAGAPLPDDLVNPPPWRNIRPAGTPAAGPRNDRQVPPVKGTATVPAPRTWRPVRPDDLPEARVDPVHAAIADKAERRRYARSLRRRAAFLWCLVPLILMGAAAVTGHTMTVQPWSVNPAPLVVGILLMIAVGMFAVVTRRKADRL